MDWIKDHGLSLHKGSVLYMEHHL